jgi:hypothetical protein
MRAGLSFWRENHEEGEAVIGWRAKWFDAGFPCEAECLGTFCFCSTNEPVIGAVFLHSTPGHEKSKYVRIATHHPAQAQAQAQADSRFDTSFPRCSLAESFRPELK